MSTNDQSEHRLASSVSPSVDLLRVCSAEDLGAAFSCAYRDHRDAVYSQARRTCGEKSADDVTHEVFLRLWNHPERFDATRGSLRTFLLAIGRHIAIDVIRSERSRRDREDRTNASPKAGQVEVDDHLIKAERADQVARVLNRLPTREREAITTAFYGQCTYREAAIALGQPEGTVKSRIRSGLERLRSAPADPGGDGPLLPNSY